MSEDTVRILLSIALAVVSGVLGLLGTWLKAKYGTEKVKQYEKKAATVVAAAEQLGALAGWNGAKKKEYAVALLEKIGIDSQDAEAFVESAVAAMIQANDELVKDKTGSVVAKTPDCSAAKK